MPDVRNCMVLITGASAGIGAACAVAFARAGARVILCVGQSSVEKKVALTNAYADILQRNHS